MAAYIIRRFFLIIPTLIGILTVTFIIVQFTPGGPIENIIAQLQGIGGDGTGRIAGGGDFNLSSDVIANGAHVGSLSSGSSQYRGAQGLDPEFITKLEKQFGFDKPPLERYLTMLSRYVRFDFGESYIQGRSVIDLIKDALPVSLSLGFWHLLISYAISIPLGIRKALREGSAFDAWTSTVIVIGYAIPSFLFGIFLMVFFAGGSFFDWFPLGHLTSDNFETLSFGEKILDYLYHLVLPLTAMVISSFATTTLLTKNCFLEEIRQQYVITARAKGLSEHSVLYVHVFRNAILVIIACFPATFMGSFFSGSLLIEMLYSLNGIGLLSYTSIVSRDYSVVFASLYIFSLIGLIISLISDVVYMMVDPRIDFDKKDL
ncbi:microcin C transport system permease protein [Bartonella sp. CDC_skunk]|uniref:microcin C ABC transporter permease YejB n=1 Tax=Bartonella TaxID=773 RepID=UPI00099B1D07|nr:MULTISPECIES: microcin C ABC transporter permease YejB [unclassified Bartonella]AQX17901.1 microcin C transport system permease protein [Bartonella sp. A1379B]AQX20821.1 microcin C transport system permease protein [Bartonella sp. CDC_skunk]AQX22414.1 microcin C transport system permease protein [Bartonella sp. 11B]AQX24305.1 microcin C transport system permease protein [Bartonella sp. 114]AQX24862.1 microcin C transport system permease protein [Bartonella sp. Coyote22sub2]